MYLPVGNLFRVQVGHSLIYLLAVYRLLHGGVRTYLKDLVHEIQHRIHGPEVRCRIYIREVGNDVAHLRELWIYKDF